MRRQDARILGLQSIILDESLLLGVGQLGQRRAHGLDIVFADLHRQQVGVGEVAVVVGLFLASHRPGFVLRSVVEARFLNHLATSFEQVYLALDLEVNRTLHETK